MKKITVLPNHTALYFRGGVLRRVLTAGSHWLGFGGTVYGFDMSQPLVMDYPLEALLQHSDFREAVQVVDVADNEVVLVYRGGNFKTVLQPGRYVYWKGLDDYRFVHTGTADYHIAPEIDRNLLEKPPVAALVRSYTVEPHELALLFVDGRFAGALEPGRYHYWKNSTVIQLAKADMRQLVMDIGGQEILTKDKAQLRINFTLQYRVSDILKALLENKEYEKQLYILLQLSIRELIGRLTLDELMESRDSLSENVLQDCREKALELGVTLIDCGLKDIILPGDVREIMNQVLIAEKRAQAATVARREETAATRSLLNTAKLMEDNTMLFKLKEMEYVEKIAEKINSISVSSAGGQVLDQLRDIFVK